MNSLCVNLHPFSFKRISVYNKDRRASYSEKWFVQNLHIKQKSAEVLENMSYKQNYKVC